MARMSPIKREAKRHVDEVVRSGLPVRFTNEVNNRMFVVSKRHDGDYILSEINENYDHIGRVRFGTKKEIIDDVKHVLVYGTLPPREKGGWAGLDEGLAGMLR